LVEESWIKSALEGAKVLIWDTNPGFAGELARRRLGEEAVYPLSADWERVLEKFTHMANTEFYLASDEATFLTGGCLDVDGGRSLNQNQEKNVRQPRREIRHRLSSL
jgi:NAD(P)-dependent dehydrogenase (short-subunit alcohol dehydrogenase family)